MTSPAPRHRYHPLPEPAAVTPSQALRWIATGWQLFMRSPLIWIAQALILFLILAALGVVPLLGWAAAPIAVPVLSAGMLAGAQALERGEALRVGHLFDGIRLHAGNLLVVGALYLTGALAAFFISAMVSGSAVLLGMAVGAAGGAGLAAGGVMFGMLVFSVLLALLITALWFAPALVMLQNVAPLDAMKCSAQACFRSPLTFLLLAIMLYVLIWVAMLPAGLGMLVLIPVIACALLAAWRDTFAPRALPAPTIGEADPHA